jgi:hypothetical protein
MPRLKSPKAKGDAYEREVAQYLSDALGIKARRAPLSGGGASFSNYTPGVPGIGAGLSDITGAPGMHIECKSVERINIHDAMRQAIRSTEWHKSPDLPTVMTRRRHMKTGHSLVVMRLDDWLVLYAAYLRSPRTEPRTDAADSPPPDHRPPGA